MVSCEWICESVKRQMCLVMIHKRNENFYHDAFFVVSFFSCNLCLPLMDGFDFDHVKSSNLEFASKFACKIFRKDWMILSMTYHLSNHLKMLFIYT